MPLVIVSDGASSIRKRWTQTFSEQIVVVLDWYHLSKKLQDLITMIARSKAEKQSQLKVLFTQLWLGQVQTALDYNITHQVIPRNRITHQVILGNRET
ncbi:MAG: hypothetical protein NW224_18935 [Leptolyngbyaceae cyanobacterium bins.302]|nr:hypothetical protein [Leptolyngbyaceae cyanobacterium bins.302]